MPKAMIIFLYGQDTYRSRLKLNEIIEKHRNIYKSGLNLRYIDFKEKNFQTFADEIKSISMFKEKKLIVLKNAFLNKGLQEQLKEKDLMIAELKSKQQIPPIALEGPMSGLIEDLQNRINKLKITLEEKNKIIEELKSS